MNLWRFKKIQRISNINKTTLKTTLAIDIIVIENFMKKYNFDEISSKSGRVPEKSSYDSRWHIYREALPSRLAPRYQQLWRNQRVCQLCFQLFLPG